jgi:hypothetical protein
MSNRSRERAVLSSPFSSSQAFSASADPFRCVRPDTLYLKTHVSTDLISI